MKRLGLALAFCLSLIGGALAQGGMGPGPGTVHSTGGGYTGPGDVVSGATAWASCARVYSAAQASTSTSLCDLVDSAAPTTVICTLRGSSTGFVDLAGTYCTGSLTPAAKCAAATGGICNVQRAFDQSGNANHFTNNTAASQPRLTFSAINGLPGMTGTTAAGNTLDTAAITVAQPLTEATVYIRTSGTSNSPAVGASSGNVWIGAGAANLAIVTGTGSITVAGTDNSFHAVQGVFNGASSVNNTDGTEATGSIGTAGFSAISFKLLRNAGVATLNGTIMEGGLWPIGFSSGQRTSMNTNLHGASGYNF